MHRVDAGYLAAALALLMLPGCAALPGGPGAGAAAPVFREPSMTVPSAARAVTVGKSSKAEVAALLGEAEVVAFDSGYEVWVYRARRARDPDAAPELAILFAPDGVASKLRVRPAGPPRAR